MSEIVDKKYPNNLQQFLEKPREVKYELAVRDANGDIIGYSLAFGEEAEIVINLEDYLIDLNKTEETLEDFIIGKTVKVAFYDTRGNFITSVSTLEIDEKYNTKLFVSQALTEQFLSSCKPKNYYGEDIKVLADNIFTGVFMLVDKTHEVSFMRTKFYFTKLFNNGRKG